MPRPGGKDRGLYEQKKPCPKCSGSENGCESCENGKVGTGIWWICYKGADHKIHREKIGSKSLARKVYEQRKTQATEERHFPKKPKAPYLKDAISRYLDGEGDDKAGWRNDMFHGTLWTGIFGDRRLDEITTEDIKPYKKEWAKRFAHGTVNHRLGFLRRVYTLAVQNGDVGFNPVSAVGFFPTDVSRNRYLTDEEEVDLRKELPGWAWDMADFAIQTGIRQGQQFGMRWPQIDFRNETVRVEHRKGRKRWVQHVHLNARAMEILRALPSRMKSEWVWLGARGAHVDAHNFMNRVFKPALLRAGIHDFVWHDLRHTGATRLRMAGTDLADVRDFLGHATMEMSLRYAHVSAAHKKDVVARLVRPATPEPCTADATQSDMVGRSCDIQSHTESTNSAPTIRRKKTAQN